ncbi:substrate-binding domain-containing protein [uncultured Cohaesibacter sp.]|uniref:substrate-binding domain-containing protein n=1 Tax=uncultured Cohaesibacter sp. TaxID=1002546 RepID=UPI00292DBAC5|nr:substrate-binding domain-containing protein [uncultured Cohaesibacter sp.]
MAGVSRSAVSRAFTPNAYISPIAKAKVMEAAAALGYRPDSLAQNMARGRSNMVVLVINKINSIREPGVHASILKAVLDSGRLPVVLTVPPRDDGASILKQHLTFPIEGIVVMSDSVSALSVHEAAPHMRPIMINRDSYNSSVDAVRTDDATGINDMVEHLWRTGHRTIAFMAGRETSVVSDVRKNALLLAIAKKGMRLVGEARGNFRYEDAFAAAHDLVSGDDVPDAIFCASDTMGFGVMDHIRMKTIYRVAKDISIIGYDDSIVAAWPSYDLSTIREDVEQHARAVIDILDRRKTQETPEPIQITTVSEFVLRSSVRPKDGRL